VLIDAVTAACARVTDAFGQRSAARAAERAALPEGQVHVTAVPVVPAPPCGARARALQVALAPPSRLLGPQGTPWYSAVGPSE
jgi:hypothetical protein